MADEADNGGFMGAVSAGPIGTVARLLWFVVLCLILFIVGLVKGNYFICKLQRGS